MCRCAQKNDTNTCMMYRLKYRHIAHQYYLWRMPSFRKLLLVFGTMILLLGYLYWHQSISQLNQIIDLSIYAPIHLLAPRAVSFTLEYPSNRNELWVDIQPQEEMLVRRVGYYDDRLGYPSLVFIAMHNGLKRKQEYFAKLTYSNHDVICLPLKYWRRSGGVNMRHWLPEVYINYILRTEGTIPADKTPLMVSITTDKECTNNLSEPVAVKYGKNDKNVKFAVCLHKGLFKITNPQMLVDWIEIHKQLGVEFFTVYMEDPNDEIKKAVQPYINELTLELLDWKLNKKTRDYGQSGVINECLYRYLYKAEYLATYDLDEIVIGQNTYTWNDLMNYLSITVKDFDKYASFRFSGLLWFDTTDTTKIIGYNETFCDGVHLPIYFNRTMREVRTGPPKMIIKPLLATSMRHHDIDKWIAGSIGMYYVPINIALTHHYRLVGRIKDELIYSNVMSRYAKPVIKSLKKMLC